MKKLCILLAVVMLACFVLPFSSLAEGGKIKIVTTIFPIYDWVRNIVGEDDSAEITMLLDSGVDLHNFQPTVQDIVKVSQCDLFIFVGGESDEWTEDVIYSARNGSMKTLSLLEILGEDVKMEEIVEGMEHDDEHEEHDDEHDEEADEHVWLSLKNAQKLVKAIAEALGEINGERAEAYLANAEAYESRLLALDAQFADMAQSAAYDTVVFGDRFPFRYLVDDYGLNYYAAFSGCSAETEASFQTILFLAQKVDELGLPAVLTIENPKTRMPETIVSSAQARDLKILSMNSMQGVTAGDLAAGADYLSIMEENLAVLREALN